MRKGRKNTYTFYFPFFFLKKLTATKKTPNKQTHTDIHIYNSKSYFKRVPGTARKWKVVTGPSTYAAFHLCYHKIALQFLFFPAPHYLPRYFVSKPFLKLYLIGPPSNLNLLTLLFLLYLSNAYLYRLYLSTMLL